MNKYTDEEIAEANAKWKQKNDRIKHIVRYLPEGTCFQCGQQKKELKEDPNDPTKIYNSMFIYCDDCWAKWCKNYEDKGKWVG